MTASCTPPSGSYYLVLGRDTAIGVSVAINMRIRDVVIGRDVHDTTALDGHDGEIITGLTFTPDIAGFPDNSMIALDYLIVTERLCSRMSRTRLAKLCCIVTRLNDNDTHTRTTRQSSVCVTTSPHHMAPMNKHSNLDLANLRVDRGYEIDSGHLIARPSQSDLRFLRELAETAPDVG